MNHGDVPKGLKKWGFKKRVYMITGVQTAHGARMERKESHSSTDLFSTCGGNILLPRSFWYFIDDSKHYT